MTVSISSLTPLINHTQAQSAHYVATRAVESNLGAQRGSTESFRTTVTSHQPVGRSGPANSVA